MTRTASAVGDFFWRTSGGTSIMGLTSGGNLNITGVYKVDGTQVVGNRVIDARANDTINTTTWDSTTAGVLDSLRDAMITHGLIAAS
jgi:hypothetical protein